jgi:hypothetical protein
MAAIDVTGIAKQILTQASSLGGDTWTRIQKSAPLYFRGYAQALANIAEGVQKKEIERDEAKIYTTNAKILLVQGITNTAHVMLYEVQNLMDKVLGILKSSINSKLPVPLL